MDIASAIRECNGMATAPVVLVGTQHQTLIQSSPAFCFSAPGAAMPVHGVQEPSVHTLRPKSGFSAHVDGWETCPLDRAGRPLPPLPQLASQPVAPVSTPTFVVLEDPAASVEAATAGQQRVLANDFYYDPSPRCQVRAPEHSNMSSKATASVQSCVYLRSEMAGDDMAFYAQTQAGRGDLVLDVSARAEQAHPITGSGVFGTGSNLGDVTVNDRRREFHLGSLLSLVSDRLCCDSYSASSFDDPEQFLAPSQKVPDFPITTVDSLGTPTTKYSGNPTVPKLVKLEPDPKKVASKTEDGKVHQMSEEERRRMRVVRNRESAERSRMRKRKAQAGLVMRVALLERENVVLRNALESLLPGLSALVLSRLKSNAELDG